MEILLFLFFIPKKNSHILFHCHFFFQSLLAFFWDYALLYFQYFEFFFPATRTDIWSLCHKWVIEFTDHWFYFDVKFINKEWAFWLNLRKTNVCDGGGCHEKRQKKTGDAVQHQFWPWFSLFTWKIYFVILKGLWLSNLKGKWLDLMGLKFLVNAPILWMWHPQQVFTKLKIDSVFQDILRLMVPSNFKNTTAHKWSIREQSHQLWDGSTPSGKWLERRDTVLRSSR